MRTDDETSFAQLRAAIRKERRWYFEALRAAEAELTKASPQSAALEQVRIRIAFLADDLS